MVVRQQPGSKRRRLPGLAVRPGTIKQARAEAGLSLAQVASGEVSRTAVFLAETGKTRPTLPTIQLIAARTGKPVEFFLEDSEAAIVKRLDLDKLRGLAAAEKFSDLAAAASAAKAEAVDPLDRAWAAFFLGQAYFRLTNPHPALDELREARETFQRSGDHWMVVDCTDLIAGALSLLEDRAALGIAESNLEACRRLRPANRALEARVIGRLGSIHLVLHNWSKAIEYYSAAVEVAGELKDLSRLGKMYGNLGGAYEHLGDLTRARSYSQKSIAIHELLNDQLSVARAENNLGLVLMKQGDLDQAREHLDRALQIFDESGVEVGKSHLLLSLAELELNGRDPDGARRFSLMARDVALRHQELGVVGKAHEIMGQAAEMSGNVALADSEFESAIAVLERSQHLTEHLVACLAIYAQVLEARGDAVGALELLKRAIGATRPELAPPAAASDEEEAQSSA
ncbi:MAG TPA: tetratricopeptide repeat protein [Candidatus Dormibacteraeota bacterium]|nr:tetratricopeptide repeat protein [Candidatus Dormibacteraeota bacterium]